MKREFRVIAFDADDTLWDCQSWFDSVEERCAELLKPWATRKEVSEGLFATEHRNLSLTGYGTKAFTLSLIENAVRISHGEISGDDVMRLINMGKEAVAVSDNTTAGGAGDTGGTGATAALPSGGVHQG